MNSFSRPRVVLVLSRMRMQIFSPNLPGKLETRKSQSRPLKRTRMRPSWGRRFSEMSRFAMILKRLTRAGRNFLGMVVCRCSMPSMR
ncbi:hypothetical protein D3C86_1244330 [compost metagenome]